MKRMLSFIIIAVLAITTMGYTQTTIPGGNVSGTWDFAGSPYLIEGEITVTAGETLTIDPGVEVIFQGHYKLIVDSLAALTAVGTELDSIIFTSYNQITGWHSIRFLSNPVSSHLAYCKLEYGKATGSQSDDFGGAIYCNTTTDLIISNCLIQHCAAANGGGIYCKSSNPTISSNLITNNQAFDWGGGIYCKDAPSPTIIDNIIKENHSSGDGGGIYISYSTPSIINNLICMNTAAINGGGFLIWWSGCSEISNNTIYGNFSGSVGGGIRTHGSMTSLVSNSIVWGNSPDQIITSVGSSIEVLYSCVEGGWGGTGNIAEDPFFVSSTGGEYYLSQIDAGQVMQSPCVDSGDPASTMIVGSTRTDYIQDEGVVDMGYHYTPASPSSSILLSTNILPFGQLVLNTQGDLPLVIYNVGSSALVIYDIISSDPVSFFTDFDPADSLIASGDSLEFTVSFVPSQIRTYDETLTINNSIATQEVILRGSGASSLQVNLSPYGSPITIPETGGSFDFNLSVRNLGTAPQSFDLWTEVLLPGFGSVDILNAQGLTLSGGSAIDRDRIQQVPEFAPAGTYTYIAYVGSYSSWIVESYDSFAFAKEGTADGHLGTLDDWLNFGESFEIVGFGDPTALIPEEYGISAYPNPFNPTTAISIQLSAFSEVNLSVYDISGRKVATLIDGFRNAGTHEVTFDGSQLASGIYVYRLNAGEFTQTGKMVLMK